MLIFHKERLVLFAVPKTGSTAHYRALAERADVALPPPPGKKHMNARQFARSLGAEIRARGGAPYTTVAVMREPIDWLGSWFRYRTRDALAGHPNSTSGLGFDGFLRDYLAPDPPHHARVGSQLRFLSLADGTIGVERLFRYERPEALLEFLAERLGGPVDLPRVNVSPAAELALSVETETLLRERLAADFGLWASLE